MANSIFSGRATTSGGSGTINTTPLPQTYTYNGTSTPQSSSPNWLASAANGLVNAGGGLLASIINGLFNNYQAKKQRKWNEEMMNEQNAWSLDMWNKTNEYNSPAAQQQRLLEAGLNPLFYGLDGSSANGLDSAQVLGYQRAEMSNVPNLGELFIQGKLQDKQIEMMNKQMDKIDADIDNTNASTAGLKLDNEFKDKTMNARVEAEQLANEVTKEQIKDIQAKIRLCEQDLKKRIAETKNEEEKYNLILAQEILAKAQAKEIVELLPYKKNLMAAQTEAQKAAATASMYNALYQKELINSGYVDKMCQKLDAEINKLGADAKNAEAIAAINAFKSRIKNGGTFTIDDSDWWTTSSAKHILNSVFEDVSIIAEVLTGPLTGILK